MPTPPRAWTGARPVADYVPDLTCIVRKEPEHRPFDWLRGGPKSGVSTVICGRATVEQYLRCGYVFDWPATDAARRAALPSHKGAGE